jgi:hypothetical protein
VPIELIAVLLAPYLAFNLILLMFNFFRFALCINFVLGLCFTRPNILGETFGYLQPIFWILVFIVAIMYRETDGRDTQLNQIRIDIRKKINQPILIFYFSYWCYTLIIISYVGKDVSVWNFLSNSVGLLAAMFAINQVQLKFETSFTIKIFLWYLLIPTLSYIVQESFVKIFPCREINLNGYGGRNWNYTLCLTGGNTTGERFTGLGGEPGIFATQLAIGIFLLLNFRIYTKVPMFIALGIMVWGIIASGSVHGLIILPIAITAAMLNKVSKRSVFVGLFTAIILLVPLFRFAYKQFQIKQISNPYSVTDRFVYQNLGDYVSFWSNNFFGTGNPLIIQNTGINLLSTSLEYGFPVILITLIFALVVHHKARGIVHYNGSLIIIILTIIFSQPAIENYLWLIILSFTTGLHIRLSQEIKISKIDSHDNQYNSFESLSRETKYKKIIQ